MATTANLLYKHKHYYNSVGFTDIVLNFDVAQTSHSDPSSSTNRSCFLLFSRFDQNNWNSIISQCKIFI